MASHATAAAVAVLVLAPLIAPGYVLSYDMVFVPHQPLRWDLVAPVDALPRAVPQDAVVAVLGLVLPGWLVQRLALAGAVYAAALGAARLVPARHTLTRVVAGVGYAWTPFLAERLLLGQWGLLLGYAALPWLVAAAIGVRQASRGALPRLVVAAAISAITPTGGLVAAAATVLLVADRGRARATATAVGAVALLNLPWLAAVAVAAVDARSDPAGVAAFAARAENWSGPLGALAGTGGIWNAQTTPPSRGSVFVPLVTLVLVALAAAGFGQLRRRWPGGAATRLAVLAAAGFAVSALGALPGTADVLAWAVGHIPGAGLLRDGHKFIFPYALLLTVCAALGTERLAVRLGPPRARLVLGAMVVLPVALMPDLALGGAGVLRPVCYPPDWDRVAAEIQAAPGRVLSLPLSAYRSYSWNRGRTVIDPAPRYLPADVLTDDTLGVGDLVVEGESRQVAHVRDLLDTGQPVALTGARWVLVHRDAGGTVPEGSLAGLRLAYSGQFLTLYENPAAAAAGPPPRAGRGLLAVVDLLVVAVLIAAIWRLHRTPTTW